MALHFVPHAGTVVACDYDLGRSVSIAGEMSKRRPVVVVSRHSAQGGPYLVVPLSTTVPLHADRTHHRIPIGSYDFLRSSADTWAKAAMVGAVGGQRLDRLRHRGRHFAPRLRAADLHAIRLAVIHAVGAHPLLGTG